MQTVSGESKTGGPGVPPNAGSFTENRGRASIRGAWTFLSMALQPPTTGMSLPLILAVLGVPAVEDARRRLQSQCPNGRDTRSPCLTAESDDFREVVWQQPFPPPIEARRMKRKRVLAPAAAQDHDRCQAECQQCPGRRLGNGLDLEAVERWIVARVSIYTDRKIRP